MFSIFEKEKVVTICMLSFLFLSVFTRLLLGHLYKKMIKEADNMATTDNKLLKQCKLKFANCYQLNNGVSNIPVFVDKFLNRLTFGPFTFEVLYHLSGQMMLLSIVASGVGICKSIVGGAMFGEILPFYIVSFLGLYIYFSVSTVVDVKGKKRILKINLIDYLENHLSSRINVTERDMEMLFGREQIGARGYIGNRNGKRTVELIPMGTRIPMNDAMSMGTMPMGTTTMSGTTMETTSIPLVDGIRDEVRKAAQDENFGKEEEMELEELLKEFLTL